MFMKCFDVCDAMRLLVSNCSYRYCTFINKTQVLSELKFTPILHSIQSTTVNSIQVHRAHQSPRSPHSYPIREGGDSDEKEKCSDDDDREEMVRRTMMVRAMMTVVIVIVARVMIRRRMMRGI